MSNVRVTWQANDSTSDILQVLDPTAALLVRVLPSGGILTQPQLVSATVQPFRSIDSEPVLTPSVTVINGSVAAVRGNATHQAGGTLGSGSFVYGTQGKVTAQGTLNVGSGFVCGILGQLDVSASSFAHTSGYLAPIIADVGAAAHLASDANLNGVFISNNTACVMNAGIKMNINANFVLDISDPQGNNDWLATSAGASASKYLNVNVGGTAYKIELLAVS